MTNKESNWIIRRKIMLNFAHVDKIIELKNFVPYENKSQEDWLLQNFYIENLQYKGDQNNRRILTRLTKERGENFVKLAKDDDIWNEALLKVKDDCSYEKMIELLQRLDTQKKRSEINKNITT